MSSTMIIGLYIACELIANVTASKPVTLPLDIVVPSAVFIYAITFTLIDLVNDKLGKQGARYVIYTAFAANLLLAAYTQFAINMPSPDYYAGQQAFADTLGSTWRIVTASLIAYLVSSLIDVQIFAWWRERVSHRRWEHVLVSNAVATAVDSVVFILIAFWGVLPVWPLIRGQYIVKMAVTVVSIPLIYTVKTHRATART